MPNYRAPDPSLAASEPQLASGNETGESRPLVSIIQNKIRVLRRFRFFNAPHNSLATRVREILAPIGPLAEDSEDLFLELGRILPELAAASDRMLARSRNLAEHLKEDGRSARHFTEARTHLLAVLAAQQEASQAESALVDTMTRSRERMRQIRQTEARLRELMVLLRVIQILFRTESAALDNTVREFFWGLSESIQMLETQMKQTFEERLELVGASAATFSDVIARTQRQSQQRAAETVAMNAFLDQALAHVETQLAENAAREREATAVSGRIAELGSQLVMALQTHDIVSQKLQHLLEGVDLASHGETSALRDFLRVAAAQIEAVRNELDYVERLVRESAGEIARAAGTSLQDCVIFSGFDTANASAAEMLAQLAATRERTLAFLRAAELDTVQTLTGVQPVVASISGLNEAMSGISRQIGMVALNAQIMAVHEGRGTALELLAARATEISRDTEELGTIVASSSAGIAACVREAGEQLQLLEGRFEAGQATLEQDAAAESTTVARDTAQRGEWLRDLAAAVEQIRASSARTLALAERFAAPRRTLTAVAAGLRALHAELDGYIAPPAAAASRPALAALEQRYTMASERVIHEQALRSPHAPSAPPPEPPREPATPPPAADLRPGDIELF